MYLTQKDNGKGGLAVVDAGFWGALLGSVTGPLSGALGARNQRRQAQSARDTDFKRDENQFLADKPNFAQDAVWDRRRRGFIADPSSWEDVIGADGRNYGRRINWENVLQGTGGGQFGADLRSSGIKDIERPDFTAPKIPGSFLGDLLSGALGAVPGAVGSFLNRSSNNSGTFEQ